MQEVLFGLVWFGLVRFGLVWFGLGGGGVGGVVFVSANAFVLCMNKTKNMPSSIFDVYVYSCEYACASVRVYRFEHTSAFHTKK